MAAEYKIIKKIGDILLTELLTFSENINIEKDLYLAKNKSSITDLTEIYNSDESSGGVACFKDFSVPKMNSYREKVKNAPREAILEECLNAITINDVREKFMAFFAGTKEADYLLNENREECLKGIKEIQEAVLFTLNYIDYFSLINRLRTKKQKSIEGYLLEYVVANFSREFEDVVKEFSNSNLTHNILKDEKEITALLMQRMKHEKDRYAYYPLKADYLSSVSLYLALVPSAFVDAQDRKYDLSSDIKKPEFKKEARILSYDNLESIYIVIYEGEKHTPLVENICKETIRKWANDDYQVMINDNEGYSIYCRNAKSKNIALNKYNSKCSEVREMLEQLNDYKYCYEEGDSSIDNAINKGKLSVIDNKKLVKGSSNK